jgi:hypothetical protein
MITADGNDRNRCNEFIMSVVDWHRIIHTPRTFLPSIKHHQQHHLEEEELMKSVRASLIAVVFATVGIGIGYNQSHVATATDTELQTPAACARCGDGQCQRSCGENEKTCPRDCGGVPQTSAH